MKKLRLLITIGCNKHCEGCCNKDYELDKLEKFDEKCNINEYDVIMLTGGEPMLNVELVYKHIYYFRNRDYTNKIYMYTAKTDKYFELLGVLSALDGITVTLHDNEDVENFTKFSNILYTMYNSEYLHSKSLRLNIFKDIIVPYLPVHSKFWQIKDNIEWIKNCPLPRDEVFMVSKIKKYL